MLLGNLNEPQEIYILNCGDAVGSYVKIVQNDDYLTLCEVEVFGDESDGAPLR